MSCSYLVAIQHLHPFCILESLLSDMPMGSCSKRGYESASPRYLIVQVNALQPPAPPLQQVFIAMAKEDNLGDTLEYVIDARDIPEVASNAIVLVDAVVQTSHPLCAAASPNPWDRASRWKASFPPLWTLEAFSRCLKRRAAPAAALSTHLC